MLASLDVPINVQYYHAASPMPAAYGMQHMPGTNALRSAQLTPPNILQQQQQQPGERRRAFSIRHCPGTCSLRMHLYTH
jgi:hypothetical protein